MIAPIRAWNRFWFQPTSARPLGMIRILFGLLALANLGFMTVDMDYWIGGDGLLQGQEPTQVANALFISPLQYLQDPISIRVAFAFTALMALGLTVGWRTRLMSVGFYLGQLSINVRAWPTCSGADVLLMTYAFHLMLSPCGAAYSIDAWLEARKRGTWGEPLIVPWAQRLIQIQISLVYILAASLKLGGECWINGTALHYVFTNAEVRRFDLTFLSSLPHYPILINLMTYSALAMEFMLGYLIWFRSARPWVCCLGLALHSGILLTINIPIFGELMWVGYLAFLTPPEFDRFLGFFRALNPLRLFRSRSRGAAPAQAGIRVDPPATPRGPHRPNLEPTDPVEALEAGYAV
jgi:hypothetical protein